MRPPFVKRQPPPESGFCALFSAFSVPASSAVGRAFCLAFPGQVPTQRGGPTHVARCSRHLGDECREPCGVCAATEKYCCPLVPASAKGWLSRSGSPGSVRRGGGAAHVPSGRLVPLMQEPAQGSTPSLRLGDTRPRRPLACTDAVPQDGEHAGWRRIPCGASEAPGAPALLPSPWRHVSLAKAVGRLRLAETARASVCARRVKAWPVSCVFSKRTRDVCPAGWWRRNNAAASAPAHVRWAFPRFLPDVPKRVPADACAHFTQRPEEAQSCRRGTRARAWLSSSKTRLRMVPMPGTVGNRYQVCASWC
jgi:hypothetical protein